MSDNNRTDIAASNSLILEEMLKRVSEPGDFPTAIEGFTMHRRDEKTLRENCFLSPVISVLIQGHKHTIIGNQEYYYGEGQCLVNGVDMPSINNITDASPEKPFMVLGLSVNKYLATQLAAEIPPPSKLEEDNPCISIAEVNPHVLDAFLRLLELLEKPEHIPILAPMIIREIHYLMLVGPQGRFLRMVNTIGTQSNQIAQAITWLRDNYKELLHVDQLAKRVNMATSTFHRHFKEVTTLSPLQFQKRLRLYEAQRLMVVNNEYASNACMAVGYESQTQFNREYKRLFGEPPSRYISKSRQMMV